MRRSLASALPAALPVALFIVLHLINTSLCQGEDDAVLIASFNSKGVEGEVEFFVEDGQTMARAFIQKPTSEYFNWKVYEFPPNFQDIDHPCSRQHIGSMYVDLTRYKTLQAGSAGLISLPGVNLSQSDGIMGRTLVLSGPNIKVCALIRPSSSNKVFVAKLYSPVGGTVTINQASFGSTISANLHYTDGSKKATKNPWNIIEFGKKDTLERTFKKEHSSCKILRKTRNLKKLSEFIGDISIAQSGELAARSHFVDPLLDPLNKKAGSLYIIVYSDTDPNVILACGKIQRAGKRVAHAKFDTGVTGYVRLEQDSPVEPTIIMLGLDDLDQRAVKYGVDDLAAFRSSTGRSCSTISRRLYDPRHVLDDQQELSGEEGTLNQYPMGDIAAKHGSLLYRDNIDKLYIDNDISLYGTMNVVGRALVIYDANDNPIACANIKRRGVEMITAVASFDGGPFRGQMIFRQPKDDPKAETTIYAILYHSDRQFNSTSSHAWKIHTGKVDTALGKSTANCQDIGRVFNPYGVNTQGWYHCQCSSKSPMRCAMGDVSARVGHLTLTGLAKARDPSKPGRYVFTDPGLPLSGPNSIINKSVAVYTDKYGEQVMACTNIISISEQIFSESTGI